MRELTGRHGNNAHNALVQVDSSVHDLSLDKVSKYFGLSTPAAGSVSDATIKIEGDPNTPSSWTGFVTTNVGTVRAGDAMMDQATMRLDVNKGWGTFGSTLFSGSNSVAMQATGKLPDSIEGFAGTAISGRLDISGNDLHHLAGGVTAGW